ncbi:NUDIX hydrolase [Patescibacteria group bacterium]
MFTKIKKWKKISSERVFEKYGKWIDKVICEFPDGSQDDFYIRGERSGALVVALTEDNKVILAKQYRPGPDEIIAELPGGLIDEGEEPVEAAARELLEETGYQAGKVEFTAKTLESAYSSEERYFFVATNCKKIAKPQNAAREIVEVELMTLDKFRDHLRTGRMSDVHGGYLGLDYLGLL